MASGYTDLTIAFDDTSSPTWANKVRDRVVNPMDTDADRTSNIATPAEGMVTYQNDENAMNVHNGTLWVPVQDLLIGTAIARTTNFTATGTELIGDSITVTLSTTMRYQLSFSADLVVGTATHGCSIKVRYKAGASAPANTDTALIERINFTALTGGSNSVHFIAPISGLTGQYTFAFTLVNTFGGSTATIVGSATQKAIMNIITLGPV